MMLCFFGSGHRRPLPAVSRADRSAALVLSSRREDGDQRDGKRIVSVLATDFTSGCNLLGQRQVLVGNSIKLHRIFLAACQSGAWIIGASKGRPPCANCYFMSRAI